LLAVVLALGASVAWGGADFLGGLTSRRLGSVLTVVLISEAAAAVAIVAVLLVARRGFPGPEFLPFAVIGGIVEAVALVALFRGLALGAMGVVSPIAATSAVVPVMFGIAGGESLATLVVVGIPLAIIGIGVVAWTPDGGGGTGRIATGVGLALVAAAGFGVFVVTLDESVARADVIWAVLVARIVLVAVIALAALAVRPTLRGSGRFVPTMIALGLLDLCAVLLLAAATTQGLLAVVGVLAALYPVVTVFLARFVLGERLRASQRVGTVIAFAGVALIASAA
jgi:drug/metabolite transporter (DMT)-like permease